MKASQVQNDQYASRGITLARQGRYRESANILALSLRRDPFQSEVLCTMAIVQSQLRNYAFAMEYFRRAEESNPYLPEIYLNRASLHLRLGYLSRARHDLGLAAGLAMDDPRFYLVRARYHFLAGQFESCRSDVLYSLELDPSQAGAHVLIGQLNERLGRYAEALEQYEKVISELDPLDAQAREGKERILKGLPFRLTEAGERRYPRTQPGDIRLSEGVAA